jgi:hypothetical protein
VFGAVVGESGGQMILRKGFDLLEFVRRRAESTPEMSSHWWKILIYVLNNQACIYRECSMQEQASSHFEMIREKLDYAASSNLLEYQDLADFYLNLQVLSTAHCAGSA